MQTLSSVPQARCNTYPSELIPKVWDKVKPFIDMALKSGSNYTLEQVHDGLLKKEMQLFTWESNKIHAAVVTTIQNKDDKRWCLILTAGGDYMKDWIGLLPQVEDWARDLGCQQMRIYGRHGWARVTDYNVDYTRLSKEL